MLNITVPLPLNDRVLRIRVSKTRSVVIPGSVEHNRPSVTYRASVQVYVASSRPFVTYRSHFFESVCPKPALYSSEVAVPLPLTELGLRVCMSKPRFIVIRSSVEPHRSIVTYRAKTLSPRVQNRLCSRPK